MANGQPSAYEVCRKIPFWSKKPSDKRKVVFIDLSDAFNSVEHNIVFAALEQCGAPPWIIDLIKDLYRGCTTQTTNLSGETLTNPIPVMRGVRQGCPLSALLFNLVLDPVLKEATTVTSFGLGYMDDIAIIFDDPRDTSHVVVRAVERAQSLGFQLNLKKCGIANPSHPLNLNNETIPEVTEERAYKYLGTEALPSTLGGIRMCYKRVWTIAEKIEFSDLTPMQKLHALRTKVIPMMYHLIENAHTTQKELQTMNRSFRKMTKRICSLPQRATNAYTHLHRLYGGPGVPHLVLLKSQSVVTSLLRTLNLADGFGSRARQLILRGKSVDCFLDAINTEKVAGFGRLAKDVKETIARLSGYLQCSLKLTRDGDNFFLDLGDNRVKDPTHVLKSMIQKEGLRKLCSSPNQGRFWNTLSHNPFTIREVFSFHTKMCDWRCIHAARLNLTPLRANFNWARSGQQNCRRCQGDRETLNHVLNNCCTQRRSIVSRHNQIRDKIADALPKRLKVAVEQRFGNLQPDMVVRDETNHKTFILDVKVSAESAEVFELNKKEMASKYDPLRRAHSIHGHMTTVNTIQVGALGSVSRESCDVLSTILPNKRNCRLLIRFISNIAVHCARNQIVTHLNGKQQTY